MKEILRGNVIAITGDFGKSRSTENLKRWIETNGGRYATKIEEDVTHLICSKEHWAKQAPTVRKARNFKSIKIVTYDWLEDSLQMRSRKREAQYLLAKVEAADKKLKAERKVKERKALKKEGKPKKETAASAAYGFFTKHSKALQSGESEYSSKPAIEVYNAATYAPQNTTVKEFSPAAPAGDDSIREDPTADVEVEKDKKKATVSSAKGIDVKEGYKSSSVDALRARKTEKKAGRQQFKIPPELNPPPRFSKDVTEFKVSPTLFSLSQPAKFKKTTTTSSFQTSFRTSPLPALPPALSPSPGPRDSTNTASEGLENYHLYVDSTGYTYDIALIRMDIKHNSNERYLVRIFESDSLPHTYACHLRYARPHEGSEPQIIVPIGSSFEIAFAAFRLVFKERTGRAWEDRMDVRKPGPDETIEDGGRPFVWKKPEVGQPRGLILKRAPTLGGDIV